MPALKHRSGRRAAELGVLDRAARDADEVVVVAGVAPHVCAFAGARKLPDRSGEPEQLDRSVDRRQAKGRLASASTVVHLDDGERPWLASDGVEHRSALWSEADVGRELELGHDLTILRTILIRK